MGEVLENLGNETAFTLHKTGTENTNGTEVTLESILVVKDMDPDPALYNYVIEYRSLRNGVLINRAAVDGSRVWFYNVASNSYSSYSYHNVSLPSKPTVIFRNLNKLVGGEDQLLMQIGQQAFEASLSGRAAATNKWLPWIPVYRTLEHDFGQPTILVESDVPNLRSIEYVTEDNGSGVNHLKNIVGYTELIRPGRTVINDWTITVDPTELAGSNYAFVPPANARAIAGALSQGG